MQRRGIGMGSAGTNRPQSGMRVSVMNRIVTSNAQLIIGSPPRVVFPSENTNIVTLRVLSLFHSFYIYL